VSRSLATTITTVESQSATQPAIPASAFFFGMFFATDAANGPGQPSFPAGTKQVFAIWNYQNMQDGMIVKREWLLNGQPWLTREKAWDFAQYGASGTLRDISIFDFDAGLPSGVYQLRLYVNNVIQPIGYSSDGQLENWAGFEILPSTPVLEAAAPNLQWDAAVLDGKILIMRDARRIPTVLFTGREIPYIAWLPDYQHLLFIDRDSTNQQAGTPISTHDDLWIVDTKTQQTQLLYKSDTVLGETSGLIPSPDGHYVATVEGTGYGDACFVDGHLMIFALAGDYRRASTIRQEQFTGVPLAKNSSVFPVDVGAWRSNTQYFTKLNGTCVAQSLIGMYSFDVASLKTTNVSLGAVTPVTGDLGWGAIHGSITDADTGAPIAGATVTCEHSSYTSPYPCSGTVVTDSNGMYLFPAVFFHDTDTIKLMVKMPGYQPKEVTLNSFTKTDLEADIYMSYPP
jgi:hypothetical protein